MKYICSSRAILSILFVGVMAFMSCFCVSCADKSSYSGGDFLNSESKGSSSTATQDDVSLSPDEKAEIEKREKEYQRILDKDSKEPYHTITQKQYHISAFIEKAMFPRFYNPVNSFQFYLDSVDEIFPIECLRTLNDKIAYCVYPAEEGGLIYVYFVKEYTMWVLHHSAYLGKTMQYTDVSSIKAGDSVDKIADIDPTLGNVLQSLFRDDNMKEVLYPYVLRDGLLMLSVQKSEKGDIQVMNTKYHKDFRVTLQEDTPFAVSYDFRILPDDYPD